MRIDDIRPPRPITQKMSERLSVARSRRSASRPQLIIEPRSDRSPSKTSAQPNQPLVRPTPAVTENPVISTIATTKRPTVPVTSHVAQPASSPVPTHAAYVPRTHPVQKRRRPTADVPSKNNTPAEPADTNRDTAQKKKPPAPRRKRTKKDILFFVAIALLIGGAVYLGIDTWMTNSRIKAELSTPPIVDNADPQSRQDAEGRDESDRDNDMIGAYTVAPDAPRVFAIDSLNVRARVLPMDVNPDNSMQAPLNIFDSGWYTGSAKPGAPGAMVINAHASGPTREGLFAYVDTLKNGDTMTVERGDGETFTYRVVHIETAKLADVDMAKLLRTYDGVEQGLNLITCAGTWLEGQQTYDQRTMVYAERI